MALISTKNYPSPNHFCETSRDEYQFVSMRSSVGSISIAQRMVDERQRKDNDGTKFDPYATLSQSHLSFGCLFQDAEDRSSFKIVITISPENTLLICKGGTVHESLPARAIKDVVASSRPDVQIVTTDGTASCTCYSLKLTVDPIHTSDGASVRHFLMGSLYDVQILTKYISMMLAGKKMSLVPVPQYDKAGFIQFGRDGLWTNKWCVLAGERMLFYNEKRSEIPFQCFTLPSIHTFDLCGPNTAHEPHPQPAHLSHLPPDYPFMAALNIGVDIELLQWPYEDDARDWYEDVMERRDQVNQDHEQELENVKKAKRAEEDAATEQERKVQEQKKKANRARLKPLTVFPFVTHTRPTCAYIAYRMPTPVQGVTGTSAFFSDAAEALLAQSLNLHQLPALNNKHIVEVSLGGGSETAYENHQENVNSDYFLMQEAPTHDQPIVQPTGHCVAITAQGQAYIWGSGPPGVLGLGPDKVEQRVPIIMTPLIKNFIVQVSCGYNHTILLTNKGEVLSFGLNHYGQLGLSAQDAECGYPRQVKEIEDPVRYIYAAANSSFALTVSGHCYVWGSNANGILGLLGPDVVTTPTIQPDLSGALQQISISPDATHGLALLYHPNGAPDATPQTQYAATVLSWGANSRGQLGMGSNANVDYLPTPSALPKLSNIVLACSDEHDVASVLDHANIIGICATNGASAVWYSNMEVMIWGRAGVTGFGNDSASPHKLRANNLSVINVIAASCGFIFMDNNNAIFQSNDTQGIYSLSTQTSKVNNATQPLYCSIVAPFLGPLRTFPKSDADQVGIGSCAFGLALSGTTGQAAAVVPAAPKSITPSALGSTNFASTARPQQQVGMSYQPPKAPGYNPPTSNNNVYMTGRKLGGPMLPKGAPPPPPGLDDPPTTRAQQAQVQVGTMLAQANQSGLMNSQQNQEAIQKDVLMAASLILGLHMEAGNRAQQPPPQQQQQQQQQPQTMDFMSMVNTMPTPQQQQQPPQQHATYSQQPYQQPQPQQYQQQQYQQQQQQPQQYQQQQQPQQYQQQQPQQYQQQQQQAPQFGLPVPLPPDDDLPPPGGYAIPTPIQNQAAFPGQLQTQQQISSVNTAQQPQLANFVTNSDIMSAPQPQAPPSRTFNNKFLAPKQQQMKQDIANAIPPPPPPDDDEDF